jgi:microcystin-dependent protein
VFSLTGDITSDPVSFTGQSTFGTAIFNTTLSQNFISNKDPVTDSLATDQMLIYRVGNANLSRMTKDVFLKHVATVPVGVIFPFAGNVVPTGYLLCDGSSVLRSTYSVLFDVIGIIYGEGDGHTTFHLPNLMTECMTESRYIIKYDFIEDRVVEPIEVAEYFAEEIVVAGGIRSSKVVPDGFLRCDGSNISRDTYSTLFDVIGSYYGDGDGHSTFNLPLLQNECDPTCIYSIKYNDPNNVEYEYKCECECVYECECVCKCD